eukprot:10671334-Alexandrium_andersonii.AAC.1
MHGHMHARTTGAQLGERMNACTHSHRHTFTQSHESTSTPKSPSTARARPISFTTRWARAQV